MQFSRDEHEFYIKIKKKKIERIFHKKKIYLVLSFYLKNVKNVIKNYYKIWSP